MLCFHWRTQKGGVGRYGDILPKKYLNKKHLGFCFLIRCYAIPNQVFLAKYALFSFYARETVNSQISAAVGGKGAFAPDAPPPVCAFTNTYYDNGRAGESCKKTS